jgi:glycosyltransferase involved in cell wall biosynthesis
MTRKLFVVVPADTPHGPVKGAYALANALAQWREVTLVTVKPGAGANAPLDPRVRRVVLADLAPTFVAKVRCYQEILEDSGGRFGTASISLCLSADAVNSLCRANTVTCASVRGNLIANYRMDYGWTGLPLAAAHLMSLRRFDHVVAMSDAMARQVRRFSGRQPAIIRNFVDEAALERYRAPTTMQGPLHFTFLGSLSVRKQPLLVLEALVELHRRGYKAVVDLIGSGPMEGAMRRETAERGLGDAIRFCGFLADPYQRLAAVDAMVLPSVSEGMSRAALEALHLGVPCVLRNADGNAELIQEGKNGALFEADHSLADAMLRAAAITRQRSASRVSLLPAAFGQQSAAKEYLDLVECGA